MCEAMYNHEFTCQGPLLEQDQEQFRGIAAAFLGNTAELSTIEIFREPGTPMTSEFASVMAYDDGGNDEIITPISLEPFPPHSVMDPFEDHGLGQLVSVPVGVDDATHLRNATAALEAIGGELDLAEWQPEHERLS